MLDASAPGVLRLPAGVWVRVMAGGERGEAQGGMLLQVATPELACALLNACCTAVATCGCVVCLLYGS